jgi:tetratricopeptide (TPR) repeat protein
LGILLVALVISAAGGQNPRPDPVVEARTLYNSGQFEQAIRKAEEAVSGPGAPSAAWLVIARSRLEIFRARGDLALLDAAREALTQVDESALPVRDRFEYLVGVGEALYLDDPPRFGTAAEFFELALVPGSPLDGVDRERAFEWWAASLDRHAQFGAPSERRAVYERILRGALAERESQPGSTVAWYWLALAARGAEDVERAWSFAVAGWIRAPQLGARGAALRADLERLVTQVILPDRARQLTPGGDPRDALVVLQTQWDDVKRKWK